MKILNTLSKLFSIAVLVAIVSGASMVKADAPTDRNTINFGLVGITFGQSAQINVVNAIATDQASTDQRPVTVELKFLDSEGNILARSTARLFSGKSTSLRLNRDFIDRTGNRVMVNGSVKVTTEPPDPDVEPPDPDRIGNVVSTFEVIDNTTQRTMFLNPGVIRGFNPQPDPPGITAK